MKAKKTKKMKHYKTMITLGVIGTMLVTAGGAYAFTGDILNDDTKREQVKEIFENNDYEAWKAFIDAQAEEMKSEDRFNEMIDKFTTNAAEREEMKAQMDIVFENNDFEGWKTLVEEHKGPRFDKELTEEDFENAKQLHQAMATGDEEAVEELRDELDLGSKHGRRMNGEKGMHDGMGMGRLGI